MATMNPINPRSSPAAVAAVPALAAHPASACCRHHQEDVMKKSPWPLRPVLRRAAGLDPVFNQPQIPLCPPPREPGSLALLERSSSQRDPRHRLEIPDASRQLPANATSLAQLVTLSVLGLAVVVLAIGTDFCHSDVARRHTAARHQRHAGQIATLDRPASTSFAQQRRPP